MTPNPSPTPRNVVLIGFMGSGKTTVGRALADLTGWTLADTDDDDAWMESFAAQLNGVASDPFDEELEDFQLKLPEGL